MSHAANASGHLFIVHGRIEALGADAVVVPTDAEFTVEPHWFPLFDDEHPSRPETWDGTFSRATEGGRLWFVNVIDDSAAVGAQLAGRLRDVLHDVALEFELRESRPPVVAMPVFGVGGGGKDGLKGLVVKDLITLLWSVAADLSLDVVVVTPDRSVYSALQHFRRTEHAEHWQLTPGQFRVAQDLGTRARDGDLALFLGAGVSMSAGLPGWGQLLEELGSIARIDPKALESLEGSPLDQAELISLRLGDALGTEIARIVESVRRVSLAHCLLAGLRCREVVTTNYDELYENAVEATGEPRPTVIPWEAVQPGRSWVLKMHGEVGRPETVVLTRRSFVRYDANFRPAGSLLQALMMTRHMLVVGTSMTDDNVIRLALEVDDFISRDHSFGTFIDVSESSTRAELWGPRFHWAHCGGDGIVARVRSMEILLDAVAMYAAQDDSWLLDERFGGLLHSGDQSAASDVRGVLGRVQSTPRTRLRPLRNKLAALGADPRWVESRTLLAELEQLVRASKNGRRATYKFIVLLWAVTRAEQGYERLTSYEDARRQLANLLSPFRIAETAPKPVDPWYALRTSSWWEICDLPTTPTAQDVIQRNARAGLSVSVYNLVRRDSVFAEEAIEQLTDLIAHDVESLSIVRDLRSQLSSNAVKIGSQE
ncbi:SIR2 family protein [Gordonia alkanivorans]|uniref:SIR2 family protein n=1 Tax=Gordonia TaxID=2053 RepID=UPI0024B6F65F|nr:MULTISPECIES: SIR2 family protein [Gordonia]MDJ0027156.1 SIR2 family protein [Gordonia alkanivorans]WJG11418.1 SIR2 family protein [Gordonia sp. Swx-4]